MKPNETKQHILFYEKSTKTKRNSHSTARKVIHKNNHTHSTSECVIKLFKGSIAETDTEFYPLKNAI